MGPDITFIKFNTTQDRNDYADQAEQLGFDLKLVKSNKNHVNWKSLQEQLREVSDPRTLFIGCLIAEELNEIDDAKYLFRSANEQLKSSFNQASNNNHGWREDILLRYLISQCRSLGLEDNL